MAKSKTVTYRWIVYLSANIPHAPEHLHRARSTQGAKDLFREFCKETGMDECTAWLYPYTPEGWADAEEFRAVGNPFDYPAALIERGPRGGARVSFT